MGVAFFYLDRFDRWLEDNAADRARSGIAFEFLSRPSFFLAMPKEPEKALWFAERFCTNSRVPLIAKGVVAKGGVLAYFGERDEQEIVSMRVSIISMA